jgi:uncharacterized protein YbjT (DUF2867 family)
LLGKVLFSLGVVLKKIAVTGAFSFSGKYVTKCLLEQGYKVVTLTNHPDSDNPFSDQVQIAELNFAKPSALVNALRGCDTLVNTYWVRYVRKRVNHDLAAQNTKTLIAAAMAAGVRRIVHVSILNPSSKSRSPYYRGKAETELQVTSSGLSYSILRPAVLYGCEDILVNNQAYFLREFPIFAIPGDGKYRIRPIFVEDFALLLVQAIESTENYILDAVGSEDFTFTELVNLFKESVGSKSKIVHLAPWLAYAMSRILGLIVNDQVLSWDEVHQLMSGVLSNDSETTGVTKLSEWLDKNSKRIGRIYHSETARHFIK